MSKPTSPKAKRTRRDELMDYIIGYAQERNGPTPTIRELSEYFQLSYTTTYTHVQQLKRENRLNWIDGKIVIPGSKWIAPEDTCTDE